MGNFIPPKGKNPAKTLIEEVRDLRMRIEVMKNAFMQMSQINTSNFKIMGRLLAAVEVLKDKGLYTDEEVKVKFEAIDKGNQERAKAALEAERAKIVAEKESKRDKDQGNPEGSSVQSEEAGSNEGGSGPVGLKVL